MHWAEVLLAWYACSKRDLPWRRTVFPYHIWVSEIMAQQTRINQLLPYYERFIGRFPTVNALAEASEETVIKLWEGLGYYARAKNLHKAAKLIVSDYAGGWPDTAEAWKKLPGIGDYTAGAIMSIAFGKPEAAVDGNVLRVHARLTNSARDIATPQAKAEAKRYITKSMPNTPEAVSQFTQALMELGALVCTPKNPQCGECPLHTRCLAYQAGRQHELPIKSAKPPGKRQEKTVLLITNPSDALLMRRRTEKLLQGLWVFYMVDTSIDAAEAAAHLTGLGYTIQSLQPVGEATHVFTHLVWHMRGFAAAVYESHTPADYVFIARKNLTAMATPAAMRFFLRYSTHESDRVDA